MTPAAEKERRRYEYGRHETFAVRHGWLGKGVAYMAQEDGNFRDEEAAVVNLGLGTRMVKSLRYWLEASGLAENQRGDEGDRKSRRLVPTSFADAVTQRDPYMEYPATWWFVHLHLARRTRSVWGWFFGDFRERVFDRSVCVEAYVRHLRLNAANEPTLAAAQRDVACLLLAYAAPVSGERQDPEDGTVSPLRDLGLVLHHGDTNRFERARPLDGIPTEAFLACVAEAAREADQQALSVAEMLGRRGGPGTVFGLDADAIEGMSVRAVKEYRALGAVAPGQFRAAPFVVRVALDDASLANTLPAGSTGIAAIFTSRVVASHVIRRVLLRQQAILNYVNPF
jgi:hypothetical protein